MSDWPNGDDDLWGHSVVFTSGLQVHDVTYGYRKVLAVDGVTWQVTSPAVIGLLGPNGAGKTTLMRLLASVLDPSKGSINGLGFRLDRGDERRSYRQLLGYLPQEFGYWPQFTALECVSYIGWLRGLSSEQAARNATHALDQIGLAGKRSSRMRTLSGGQKRRVGIAQAIVNQPSILLLDEPTAGLDPEQRLVFRKLLRLLASRSIVIVATHLVEDVATACDQVLIMRAGKFVFDGSPQDLAERGDRQDHDVTSSRFEGGYLDVLSRERGSE